jgi:hypothetical protein
MYKFCKSCSSSHTEHSEIGFAICRFFNDFIWILQDLNQEVKTEESISFLALRKFKISHKYPPF